MHDRSPYRNGVDFRVLAEAHPPLKPLYVIDSSVLFRGNSAQLSCSTHSIFATSKGAFSIDFKNEEAQRQGFMFPWDSKQIP